MKALNSIRDQLTTDNVAYELFGDVAGSFEEVREVEMEFAIEHWEEVKDSVAMKEMEALAEAGELPHAVATTMQLARRLCK